MAVPETRHAAHTASKRERIAFVLVDGLADVHIPDMADLTPLEAADTPTFDAIAGLLSHTESTRYASMQSPFHILRLCSCWFERLA